MKLILTEEQQFLKDTAQSFARDKTPVTHFREIRDSENINCWDEATWKEMVDLGWSGILVPEQFGGSEFGMAGISVIMQELGKTASNFTAREEEVFKIYTRFNKANKHKMNPIPICKIPLKFI